MPLYYPYLDAEAYVNCQLSLILVVIICPKSEFKRVCNVGGVNC